VSVYLNDHWKNEMEKIDGCIRCDACKNITAPTGWTLRAAVRATLPY
jgi:Na+-translocating ferredoxin:NAD+ oxidoreductase RnfC subunit